MERKLLRKNDTTSNYHCEKRERERESQVVKRETSDEIMERSEKDYLGDEKGEQDMSEQVTTLGNEFEFYDRNGCRNRSLTNCS
jgi:hypothetical protein